MTTIIDINTKQSQISEDAEGFRIERYAIVHGVTGDADQKLKNALADAGLPSIGDTHPEISGITLQSKRATVIDTSTVQVQLSYYFDAGSQEGASNADLNSSGGTVIEEVKSAIDDEDTMQARYNFGGGLYTEYFTAERESPRQSFTMSWQADDYPRAEIDYYTGRVNDDNWNGYAPGTALCTGISARSQGDGYEITAGFSIEPDGWQFKARTSFAGQAIVQHGTDADTTLDHTTGIKEFNIYKTADFDLLSLTIPGPYVTGTGTAFGGSYIEDSDIVTGGKTIILTLTGDTWVASGTTFDAQRQNILDGLTSNQSEAAGWDAQNFAVTDVVRTSSTVVTITLSAEATYSITKTEDISIEVPASALVTSSLPLVCTRKFKIIDLSLYDG